MFNQPFKSRAAELPRLYQIYIFFIELSIILYNFIFQIGIYADNFFNLYFLQLLPVLFCPQFSSASASRHSIGVFSSRGPSGSMRPGSTPRRCPFRPSCRAAFGGPRPLSRPGVRRRCGPPGRAFLLSGLKIGRLRNVLHTNSFCWNHRGRRVRFSPGSGVEPRPAVRCGFHRSRGAVEPRPPVWPAPVVRCVGIWGAGLLYRFAFARNVRERRQRFAFWVRGVVFAPSRPPVGPLPPKGKRSLPGFAGQLAS